MITGRTEQTHIPSPKTLMKKGKLVALAAGYLAGMAIALRFGKGGKGKGLSDIAHDIGDIHKNLWTETEAAVFSEENKQRVAEMRDAAKKEIEDFKKEATKKYRELASASKDKAADIRDEVEKLYDRRMEILEKLRKKAADAIDATEETSSSAAEKIARKVEDVAEDLRDELEDVYAKLKKQFKK
jgi:vacuolar-type H+-ATPase subunit H